MTAVRTLVCDGCGDVLRTKRRVTGWVQTQFEMLCPECSGTEVEEK